MRASHVLLPLALVFATGTTSAAAPADRDRNISISGSCEIRSDYDFALSEKSVILTRKSGAPKTVLMRQGRLFIDDRWVTVSTADAARLADYERDARATIPLAEAIGRDAVEIAFVALGEVAKGFSSDPKATEQKMAQARVQLQKKLSTSIGPNRFSSDALGEGIGEAVAEVIPLLVGDIVGGALRAAFTGDTKRLEEMDGLDAKIEAIIEPRTAALERNADEFCRRMQRLDAIDDALEFRLDGKPLDLLHVEQRAKSERKSAKGDGTHV